MKNWGLKLTMSLRVFKCSSPENTWQTLHLISGTPVVRVQPWPLRGSCRRMSSPWVLLFIPKVFRDAGKTGCQGAAVNAGGAFHLGCSDQVGHAVHRHEIGPAAWALFSLAASPDIQGSGISISVAFLWSLQTSALILNWFFLAGFSWRL